MANYNKAIGGVGSGAMIGGSISPGWGHAIGGVIGGITGLFGGDSEEEIRKKRKAERDRKINEALIQARARTENYRAEANQRTQGMIRQAQQDVARRAAASGRVGDIESSSLPIISKIGELGNEAQSSLTRQQNELEDRYQQALLESEMDFQARPIEPDTLDTLMGLGSSYLQQSNYDKYLEAMKGENSGVQNGSVKGLRSWQPTTYQQKKPYNFNDVQTW